MTPQELVAEVNGKVGNKAVYFGSDPSLIVTYIPTDCLPFDVLMGGGFPRGRMVELYGDWSTLKSVIGLYGIASAQRSGGTAALIDTEHAFDPEWAARCGVDVGNLILWPNRDDDVEHTGEEAMDVAANLIANGVDILVFDSIAAALPQEESAKRMARETTQPARLAQLMSRGLRRLTAVNNQTAIVFINQTRLSIGVIFGSPETVPGGKSMPFYASHRVRITKTGRVVKDAKVWNGDKWETVKEQTAQKYRAELIKSKLTKPFKESWLTWDLVSGQVDIPGYLIAQGLEMGLIRQTAKTWQYGVVKAVGREAFKTKFANTPPAMQAMEEEVRQRNGLSLKVTTPQTRKRIRRNA
jgi:recombination protein RecA